MNEENFVRLKIISPIYTPEYIDNFVGICHDKSWKTGDCRGRTIIKEKNNGWILNSLLEKEKHLYDHIESLIKRIDPIAEKIKSLSKESHVEVEFSCAIYYKNEPPLHFDANIVSKISYIGASLDIDLYYMV